MRDVCACPGTFSPCPSKLSPCPQVHLILVIKRQQVTQQTSDIAAV